MSRLVCQVIVILCFESLCVLFDQPNIGWHSSSTHKHIVQPPVASTIGPAESVGTPPTEMPAGGTAVILTGTTPDGLGLDTSFSSCLSSPYSSAASNNFYDF